MNLPLDPIALTELAEWIQAKRAPDASLLSHFQTVPDFRRAHGRAHLLADILTISFCAMLADCDNFVEFAEYAQDNETWLRSFLELPNGTPSHDTFRRVFLHLAPGPFCLACVNFARDAGEKLRRLRLASGPCAQAPEGPTPQPDPSGAAAKPPPLTLPSTAAQALPLPDSPPRVLPRTLTPPAEPTPALPAPDSACGQRLPTTSPPIAPTAEPPQGDAVAARDVGCSPPAADAGTFSEGPPMQEWTNQEVAPTTPGEEGPRRHLSVDGKTARGSFDTASGQRALHLVSVWDSEERLTLGQVAVDTKSNEITAIPAVLRLVDLRGAVVSIDAMGTQEVIAAQIREGKGDFVLAVKENQGRLYEDVLASFIRHFEEFDGRPYPNELEVQSKGEHGRNEKRTYIVLEDVSGIRDLEKWQGVKRLIMVHRECEASDGTTTEESRYFIGSAVCGVDAYARWIRGHWGIENQLHWVLDVIFHEDASRVRKDHGTENLAILRRLAVSLLGNDKTIKRSIRGKRKKAARNKEFLTHILFLITDIDPPLETPKSAPLA